MENLQGFSGFFSAPGSVRPSRVSSPTLGAQSIGLPRNHAQMQATSLSCANGTANPQRAPVIHKLTPEEGSKSGGMEVTCLGSGFCQGLEVMFGDAQATTTTFWGESALVCLVPPALAAGAVPVTFKYNYEHNLPSPSNKHAFFRYIDDEEQELMKRAVSVMYFKFNGTDTDTGNAARNIINQFSASTSFTRSSIQGSNQRHNASSFTAAANGNIDLEAALLKCLDIVDLDDSPYQARLNTRSTNGQSMLHLSASLGLYRLTAGLLARGANPDLRDNNGMTPMHMACLRGHTEIIRKLRSAGGYIPADMATSKPARDANNTFDLHARPRSADAILASHFNRASSLMSFKTSRGDRSTVVSAGARKGPLTDSKSGDEGLVEAYRSQPATPAQIWAQTRRNSIAAEPQYPGDPSQGNLASTSPSLIQQLQQSVHRTLLPLQFPALLPIPNLPDYQAYPVVKRISSLVPQRISRPGTANTGVAKLADYHWWELLTGVGSSPPAYDEIYPENAKLDLSAQQTSLLRVVGDAYMNRKCIDNYDQVKSSSGFEIANLQNAVSTPEQLNSSHAMKVKRLRKDRKLFLIWASHFLWIAASKNLTWRQIPLLILVLVAMLKDRVPQALYAAQQAFRYVQSRLQEREVEIP